MFFTFKNGSAQDGEAAGGLADMNGEWETLECAKRFADGHGSGSADFEILDGSTGAVYFKDRMGHWWSVRG